MKVESSRILFIVVYVDDIIFGGNDDMSKNFSSEMQKEFEISMIGDLNFFLGLKVNQNSKAIFISQSKYVRDC